MKRIFTSTRLLTSFNHQHTLPSIHPSIQVQNRTRTSRTIHSSLHSKRQQQQYEYFKSKKEPFLKSRNFVYFGGSFVTIGLCYYIFHLEKSPISNRTRFIDVSKEEEKLMAKKAYHEIVRQFNGRILPSYHPTTVYVRKVANRLISILDHKDKQVDWKVFVIDNPQPNAFVLPGGQIFVFTGILPIVQNEDGMAAVLGHEMAHQIARHSSEKLSMTRILILVQILSTAIFSSTIFSSTLMKMGILMPFSRKMENEADFIGLQLMSKACFNPKAAIGLWERFEHLERKSGQSIPEYASTHPTNKNRMKSISEWIPDAEQLKIDSNCKESSSLLSAFGKIRRY